MSENKQIKINLITVIIIIVLIIAIGIIVFVTTKNNDSNNKDMKNIIGNESTNSVEENNNVSTDDEYFILYNGYEMKTETGVQTVSDMPISESTEKKYNTTYYNYENGEYKGETEGVFGEPTYEGVSVVSNIARISISSKYNAIPRTYSIIEKIPEKLQDMLDYSSVDIHSIDLDGDEKDEYLVCYTINYTGKEFENGEIQATSGIILFDSELNKIADLVTLEDGFWGNLKNEENKIFLSLNDVEYIDIDNDNIMEIIIKVPTYEGNKISILKYNKGDIEGEINLQASVNP